MRTTTENFPDEVRDKRAAIEQAPVKHRFR
jgi:hypothetical protein